MNSNNTRKYTTSYNSFFYNNKKYHDIKNQNQTKNLSKTQMSNSNDRSLVNSSLLSTKINSSDSFLFKSIYINNSMKLFKLKHLSIRNKYFTSTYNKSKSFDFKKYLMQKFSENLEKIKLKDKLPQMNNANNIKNNNSLEKAKTGRTIKVERISFFDKIFRNELLNIDNKNINLEHDKDKSPFYFKESVKKRALIRNYIYDKEKKYEKDLKDKESFRKEVNQNYKKINYLYNDALKNKINRIIDYNSFLKEKIKIMKQEDFGFYKQIEILIKQIKDLFIQIKIKSDSLWLLFDIRNFLICVKEKIALRNLPPVFRCYNSEYLDELTKLSEIDISSNTLKKKKKNKSNFFRIPLNLLVYIQSLNGLENEKIDEKFRKYLNPNYRIFESPDDFIKIYRTTEKRIINYLTNYLDEADFNEKIKSGLTSTIKNIENDANIFQDEFNMTKNTFITLKNNNDKMNKIIRLSLSSGDIKTEKKMDEKHYKPQNSLYIKYNEGKYDEKFLKLIRTNIDVEKTNFLYKFNQLKKVKNFKTEKEYVYYYISNNILNFYKICPNYFYNLETFDINKFNKFIDNTHNSNNFKDSYIRKNIFYLLNIYERAINNFLYDYKNNIKIFKSTGEFYKIRKEIINEKKLNLFQNKKKIDLKIKKMKIDKYNRKFFKFRYFPRKIISSSPFNNIFSKEKSLEIKKNNKIIDENENNMLKY